MTRDELRELGPFCRLIDHKQGVCDCAEIAALIDRLVAAERARCAVEADLVAENFRESSVIHGADEPLACYRSRAAGADSVARRIRNGVPT